MIIQDKIYGRFKIEEPVLLELINSKPVQRLRGIAQLGVPDKFYHLKGYSRFEHSVGVMLLLKKLNTSLEEQVAGLLHDVSHTAFSHVVDWAIGHQAKEDHQDKEHNKFIYSARVSSILKRCGFNPNRIFNLKQFNLLEKEIPDLCADRIDYSLRDPYFKVNPKIIIRDLINIKGKIVFINFESANLFAKAFLRCQREHWGGYEGVARYYLLSSAIKGALDKKILKIRDFYQDDNFVVNKLLKSKNKKILKILAILKHKPLPKKISKKSKVITKKFRYVDPEFLLNNKIKKLSQVSDKFKNFLEKQRILNQKGVRVF